MHTRSPLTSPWSGPRRLIMYEYRDIGRLSYVSTCSRSVSTLLLSLSPVVCFVRLWPTDDTFFPYARTSQCWRSKASRSPERHRPAHHISWEHRGNVSKFVNILYLTSWPVPLYIILLFIIALLAGLYYCCPIGKGIFINAILAGYLYYYVGVCHVIYFCPSFMPMAFSGRPP